MKALLAVLMYLDSVGITLADFDIDTHYNDQSYWSCDAYVAPDSVIGPDATIVVCAAERKIHILKVTP